MSVARLYRWLELDLFRNKEHDKFLARHGQRINYFKFLPVMVGSFYLGSLAFYYMWKTQVVEPKWVQEYGQDTPVHCKRSFFSWVQVMRAKYIHFARFRIFYFIEEQVIDPLADDQLNASAFDVYHWKRVVRAIKYD
jgi:hypothetical protein